MGMSHPLENNGKNSWLRSGVWRAYSTEVGVSNAARLCGCDPGLGGTTGSLPLAAQPFYTTAGSWIIWAAHHTVMSTLCCLLWCFWRDVTIECVNSRVESSFSRVLARGVARKTHERVLLWVWDHSFKWSNPTGLFKTCPLHTWTSINFHPSCDSV